jgi:hypothetical protein
MDTLYAMETCKSKYENDKNSFFDNIGNDEWHERNYFPLK